MYGSDPEKPIELLDRLSEHVSDVLWVVSDGWDELVFVNAAYEEVWGRSMSDLQESPLALLDGIHPGDRELVRDAMDRLSAGEPVDVECRVNADESYHRWVRVRGRPVRDDREEGTWIVGSARDITERKALQSERDRYRTIIENIPDGVYLFDTEGELIFVNRAAVERSALSHEELLGGSVPELLAASMVDGIPIDEVLALHGQLADGEREEFRETLWFETVDGPRPFAVRSARGESETGEFIGVVSVLRDIVDRVEAEEELRRKNERLEEFASLASHDLRNPLSVAAGRLQLAREECESEHLDAIERAHERMTVLIEDLLTLARVGDETATNLEAVALGDLIDESWRNVETNDATLVTDTEQTIRAAPGRLQQLLENLIRNAVEHGGSDVTVRIGDLDGGFYVADDGPGISAEGRDRIFESGYSTTRGGTGLGLNIVGRVVEAHGWEIRATEGGNGGARFEVTGVELAR